MKGLEGDRSYLTIKSFLDDIFSEQFVKFTNHSKMINQQNGEDLVQKDQFLQNQEVLFGKLSDKNLPFPKQYEQRFPG